MTASPYRCSRCGRIGIAAIGNGKEGPIAEVGGEFDICDCGGRLQVISVEMYDLLNATPVPVSEGKP